MIDTTGQGAVGWGAGLAVAALALTVLATRRVLAYLHRRQILDMPNERSSHSRPTPRGGGLATTPVMAVLLLTVPQTWTLAVGALVLLAVSWIDDRRGLAPLPRLAVQIAVIGAALAWMPADSTILGGALPVWAERLGIGIAWAWFVNLYNFMDGIDGITGVETFSLGVGIAIVGGSALAAPALVVAAIAAGFLAFNWHPAKLFLGDSGSVPFGFVLGGLLVALAAAGHLLPALILPGYYLADATITLGRRALAGEKIWRPHRQHFYQRAVQGGKRHDQVALLILGGNISLTICAWTAAHDQEWLGGSAAVAVVTAMLMVLRRWSRATPPATAAT